MKENTSAKGIMIGFLAGGAIGGLTALLFAPKSGRELRKDISIKSKKLVDDGGEYLDNAKLKATELLTESRKKAEDLINDAKTKAATIITQGRDYVTDGTNRIKDAVKSGVETYNEERKLSRSK